uniref:DUF5673 domain-containing protein n=1 Tax=candidate division WWE3 bacterium TaxID=2053526 RepID=A0A7C4XMK6_UNCKA
MPIQLKDITNFLGITNIKSNDIIPPLSKQPKPENVTDVTSDRRLLYEWTAPNRVSDGKILQLKQNRSAIVIGLAIGFLLILMQEFLLIAVVASLMFLKYVLASTKGEQVRHRILNRGVEYAGDFFTWDELKYFFFTNESGLEVLCIDTMNRFPGRLHFNIEPGSRDRLQKILEEYMSYVQEAPKMFGDNLFKAAMDRISLDSSRK